jgi:hypothetical protein
VLRRFLSRRETAVIAGLLLVLVPTLFSVFVEWTRWADGIRVAVVAGWLLAATLVVTATARQSEHVEELVGTPLARRKRDREVAARRLIRTLLGPGATRFPDHYELRLFLPTGPEERLMPSYERGEIDESDGWASGQGATGLAWSRNAYIRVEGRRVTDKAFGLTGDQVARYGALKVVAAEPVRNSRGRPIGVLSVSSKTNDGFLMSHDGLVEHIELAEVLARVLIDVLRVARD